MTEGTRRPVLYFPPTGEVANDRSQRVVRLSPELQPGPAGSW